ncbi:Uncharacterized conserved protein [Ceraceosorus bombacis]|uniref:Uncharacterized conserved protein n=1 Tax=Ceraceosorus bombacis TaxID=401625 RepID=A0A0N7LBF8_9BASI|nr:Uncharacterized conserved protein [Ceraceosorus bombacis]
MSIGNAEASTSKRKHRAEAEAAAGAPIKRRKSRGEDVEVDASPASHALSQTRGTQDEDGEDEPGKGMSATGPTQRPHGSSLAAALSTTSADALRSALSTLRRETRCAVDSAGAREPIAASDGRITLVTQLLTAPSHHGQDDQLPSALASLLAAWDLADAQSLPTLIPLPLFCLAQMLTLLSAHQPTHEMGEAVISALLPPKTQALETSGNGRAPAASSSSIGAYWRRMQAYLVAGQGQGASHGAARGAAAKNETLTLATSRLMLAMSCFAGSKYASRIFDAVSWSGSGAMPRLMTMRRMRSRKGGHKTSRGSTVANPGTFDSPDVRTLWTLLLLSFLRAGSPALSSAVLDLGRPYVPAIVSGLPVDSPEMVVHTLQVLHDSLLVEDVPAAARSALRVPRSKVVALFNEWCIKEILKLYDRKDQTDVVDGEGNRLAVGDVAHHFLTTLCTHPGRGVCFVDRGWYAKASQQPNEEDAAREGIEGSEMADGELAAGRLGATGDNDESELGAQRSPRVYNKILLGVSRALSPSRSLPQQQLTIDILRAAPELVGAYFDSPSGSGLSSSSLEPRPHSSAWVSSVSFLSRVLALPLPERREDTPSTPPPFKNIVAALLPSPLTRAQLQKGLASPDRLVQHITMRLLTRLLDRLVRFKEACHAAISDLQQGQPDSAKAVEQSRTSLDTSANPWDGLVQPSNVVDQWKKRWDAVEKEARQRLPDVASMITSLSAQALGKETSAAPCQTDGQTSLATRQGQRLLLEEGRLRVLLYYCQVSPASALPEAARLDYVRLLLAQSAGMPMAALCRLHALRILSLCIGGASGLRAAPLDVFATVSSASSSASSPKTFFGLLLQLLARDSQESGKASALIRSTCSQALISVMRESVLFEHDPAEWSVWVHAFSGAPNVDSPDRADHVRAFLEDCASRCRKTHHRYLEMSRKHREENTVSDGLSRGIADTELAASPLMATLVEQLSIRLRKHLLDEADVASGTRGTMQRRALVGYAARLLVLLLSSGRPAHPLLAWARELHAAAQADHDVFVVSEMGHALELIEVVAEGRKSVQASPEADCELLRPFKTQINSLLRSQYSRCLWPTCFAAESPSGTRKH